MTENWSKPINEPHLELIHKNRDYGQMYGHTSPLKLWSDKWKLGFKKQPREVQGNAHQSLFRNKVQNECSREKLGARRNQGRGRPGNCSNQ